MPRSATSTCRFPEADPFGRLERRAGLPLPPGPPSVTSHALPRGPVRASSSRPGR